MPNVAFQLSKTKVQKWFPCRLNYSIGFSKSPIHCWYQVYVSYLQRRTESTTNTHSTQNQLSCRITYPVHLHRFVPAGTAVHNQQDRRRASDGGRAMHLHGKDISSACTSSRLYMFFELHDVNYGTAECNQHERWRASEGGRVTEGERYVCTQQYSCTCSSIYNFSGI